MRSSRTKSNPYVEELLLLMEQRKRQCENSFYEFVKDSFAVAVPGEVLQDNWHIKYLCDILQKEVERVIAGRPKQHDIIINVPPRSLKSFICTIALSAWAWTRDNTLRFISTSYSGILSIEHNVVTRNLIRSEWYQELWGNKVSISEDEDTKGRFTLASGGGKKATSVGAGITGSGGDVIVIDDPLNPVQAASDIERSIANEYYDKTLPSRLDHPEVGVFIIIMKRLHEDDLTGHLLKKNPENYLHICIPAELTNNVRPKEIGLFYKDGLFFPRRFTKGVLDGFRINIGSMGFAGQYLQTPGGEGGVLIKGNWYGRYMIGELPENVAWDFAIDGAYTKDKINNASVLMAYTKYQNDLYIRAVASVWKEFPDFVRFIKDFCFRNGYTRYSRIYIEPRASGIPAAQILKRHTNLNIIIDKPPTTDKVTRVTACLPFLEARRCNLLADESWIESFIYETTMFPNAKEDGQVDCLCIAVDKVSVRRGGGKIKIRTMNVYERYNG